jgi:hypothetical protein
MSSLSLAYPALTDEVFEVVAWASTLEQLIDKLSALSPNNVIARLTDMIRSCAATDRNHVRRFIGAHQLRHPLRM